MASMDDPGGTITEENHESEALNQVTEVVKSILGIESEKGVLREGKSTEAKNDLAKGVVKQSYARAFRIYRFFLSMI